MPKKIWVPKDAEFYADFETVEKVEKNHTTQVINKNETEMCTFYTFYTFDHMFIRFVCLQLFWCILALLPSFEAKRARNGSKIRKRIMYRS